MSRATYAESFDRLTNRVQREYRARNCARRLEGEKRLALWLALRADMSNPTRLRCKSLRPSARSDCGHNSGRVFHTRAG